MRKHELDHRLAEVVSVACLNAAQQAYEDSSIGGLCEEGHWKCAMDAIRSLDIEAVIASFQK